MEVHNLPIFTLLSRDKKRAVAYMRLPILLYDPILFFLMRGFNGLCQFFPFAKGFPVDGFAFAIAI